MSGLNVAQVEAAVADGFAAAGEFVRPVTLKRPGSIAYDPAQGRVSSSVADETGGEAIATADPDAPDGDRVAEGGPEKLLVRDLAFAPAAGDWLVVDGATHRVLAAADASAGAGLLWRVTLR